MKIKINRNQLVNAMKSAADIAGGKLSLTILSYLRLETKGADSVTITGTNLDITIERTVACEVNVPGAATIPARLAMSIVSAMIAEEIEIAVDKDDGSCKAVITGGDARFRVGTMAASSFPKAVEVDGDCFVETSSNIMSAVSDVVHAASNDGTRRALQGVFITAENGRMTCVATDGRRLASVVTDVSAGGKEIQGVILPVVAVRYLQKVFGGETGDAQMEIVISKNGARFSTSSGVVQTKLIDDAYPNWKCVIPRSSEVVVAVDRQELMDSVRLATISASVDLPQVQIAFEPGSLVVNAANSDVSDARTSFPIKYSGEPIVVNMQPHYLLDALAVSSQDEVTLKLSRNLSPVAIESEADGFLSVIMPIRNN